MADDSSAAFIEEFTRLLCEPPWWWQASGRTEEEWHRDRQRQALANKCPARIHDDPIFCDLGIGPLGPDGLARCHERFIRHVLRPTGNPDRPWADTGRRERVA